MDLPLASSAGVRASRRGRYVVYGQPDSIEIALLFLPRIDRWTREGCIGPEETHDITLAISGDEGGDDVPPAISTVAVAIAQGAPF